MPEEINFYTLEDIRDFALGKMRELNIYPADPKDRDLIMDGSLQRYRIEGRKQGTKDGRYTIHTNDIPSGYLQDMAGGADAKWTWSMKSKSGDKAIKTDFDYEKWETERAKREAEQEERYAKAADEAGEYFRQCEVYDFDHPYLEKKRIGRYTIRIDRLNNFLVVPLYNITGKIISVQKILPDGTKRFFTGARSKGVFFPIGLRELKDNKTPILLGEGVATMATVRELTGDKYPCVAAMNCGNFGDVAKALKSRYANPIIIMADNDLKTQAKTGKNPGLDAANKLKEENQGLITGILAPPFNNPEDGSDWNDYAVKFGNDTARNTIINGKQGLRQLFMSDEERAVYFNHIELTELLGRLDPSIQLPPQEFIGGLFPRGFISSVVAPSGTGKTIFMQKTVSDLSLGGTFFDGISDNEPPRKCLIFAAEAGYDLLLRRGASFKWAINPDNVIVANQYTYESNGKTLMLDDKQGLINALDIIDTVKPDIIFFDTFGSFHEKDENKSTEMKPIIRHLTDVTRDKNIAMVLNHHSRKRTSKERALLLNQDDVIGSSIFNRLVSLIIGIEHVQGDEENLQVRPLKSWFRAFKPFNYRISEDLYGHSVIETNLAPEDNGGENSRVAVWNYLQDTFKRGEWFAISQIELGLIDADISDRLLRKIITEFIRAGKLNKRGTTKNMEYSFS